MVDWVRAPDLVGLSVDDALKLAEHAGVDIEASGPGDVPLIARSGVVIAQDPPAGIEMVRGGVVLVTVDDGPGGTHVREPRRPSPTSQEASGMVDEETGDPVG